MPAKKSRHNPPSVFINVPYDKGYERLFVAIIASLISIGNAPHCTLEIAEVGQGRLERIFGLIKKCYASIHELSRVGSPARFNMPFELGLACAISRTTKRSHKFILFEKKEYRLDKTLSDLKGHDPYIHNGNLKGTISSVLNSLSQNNNLNFKEVYRFAGVLWKSALELKKLNHVGTVFNRVLYRQLIAAALKIAVARKLIKKA